MDEALEGLIAALTAAVRAATLPADSKHTATWCVAQLSALYVKYSQTNESRYSDEITRLVRGLLAELAKGEPGGAKAQKLEAAIPERFRILHEQLGLPNLQLKVPRASPARTRKTG